jgi:hypothetical protein
MARGPSSLNVVSLLLLLVLGGAGYGAWKFFPVYWQAWQVDKVLADGTTRAYYVAKIANGFEQAQAKERLIRDLRAEVVALGVRDPDMALGLSFSGDRVDLTCDYRAIVIHPVAQRFTVMPMHRLANGSLAPPKF